MLISPLSTCSVFMELFYNDTLLGGGTAFYVRKNDDFYLVSNWHNFSGRHPHTKLPLHSTAAVPNRVDVHNHNLATPEAPILRSHAIASAEGAPLWFEHPKWGSRVDVGALPVSHNGELEMFDVDSAIREVDYLGDRDPEAGDQVFVLGFPFGLSATHSLPIWKAATIASEPEVDIDDLPLLYIDTATRPGMSGSPVVKHVRRAVTVGGKNGVSRFHSRFVGIYSGRIVPKDEIEAQLGKVWKAPVVYETIAGQS